MTFGFMKMTSFQKCMNDALVEYIRHNPDDYYNRITFVTIPMIIIIEYTG